ncbi:arsenate reductase (azurin) small subunit [Aliarcobacter skirrowii]|jgi:arsenite oxidase small subunit|uniref:arsenate reductase (azurin) small subunit n=1 Tax=Aliarcobacter skirrowii TaxID=28200 RepID=UPI0029B21E5A|nr:arsenate reductase (azurin) small subunit [Aliarcobacter skirrowii]MDX4062428.1 arsenate reductase (azurin) small subunit [Aliarcobacter skirrowii]
MEEKTSSRRGFLKAAGLLAGTAAIAPSMVANTEKPKVKSVFSEYEFNKIGTLSQLKKDGELDFSYPDKNSLCKAIYVNGEVKAYSVICTHKGCPTLYNKGLQQFECPCHYTKYDAIKDGQMIIGHATGKLPQVILEIKGDDIYAVGFDGLIFGRINNNIG